MNTTEQIALKIAHRTCTTYSHNERIKYMFTDQNMIDFAEKFLVAWLEQQSQEPVGYFYKDDRGFWNQSGDPVGFPNMTKLFLEPPPAIPDWISVEDRLPEEHQEVMCAFGNGNMLILEFDRSLAPYRFIDRDSGKWWSLKIKHWMPLPNPPAQGEQE